jgi:head-tail adaptor
MVNVPGTGAMTELLHMQENVPAALAVTLTRAGTLATGTTAIPHEYLTRDTVTINVTEAGYNGRRSITVTSPTTFTFPITSGLATPTSGTVTYLSDPQGGRRAFWADRLDVWAELVPLSSTERVEREAIRSNVRFRFRVHLQLDLRSAMRARWSPSWGGDERQLEVVGLLPANDPRFFYLEMAVSE